MPVMLTAPPPGLIVNLEPAPTATLSAAPEPISKFRLDGLPEVEPPMVRADVPGALCRVNVPTAPSTRLTAPWAGAVLPPASVTLPAVVEPIVPPPPTAPPPFTVTEVMLLTVELTSSVPPLLTVALELALSDPPLLNASVPPFTVKALAASEPVIDSVPPLTVVGPV